MRHRWLTFVTVASLYGTYRLYAAVITPLTEPQLVASQHVDSVMSTEIKPQSISGRIAQQYLRDQQWAATAKYQWRRSEESFLYFEKHFRIDDDKQNRVRVTPFALVWIDPRRPDAAAYTLVCSSAEFEFESRFQIGQSGTGRIIGGRLQGEVRMTGPDHLLIVGRNFSLSEREQRLYSDSPVQFAFGPEPGKFEKVRGRAASVDITLHNQARSVLGNDMPRIGGLRKATLMSDVSMELVMEQHGKPVPVTITSRGPFTYSFEDLVATFRDHVLVDRPTHASGQPEQFDRLRADHLAITFDENDSRGARRRSGAQHQPVNLDVAFRSLRAYGEEVLLGSEENDLTASMQELRYDAVSQTVDMHSSAGPVHAFHRDDELLCPTVRLTHDDDDNIVAAECEGSGQLFRRNPQSGQVEVESTWTERLRIAPDDVTPWDRLTITGNAHVLQHQQKSGIIADVLTAWLDSQSLQDSGGDLRAALAATGTDDELPVKRIVAQSNVAMVSPSLHLETQHLEADFIRGRPAVTGQANDSSATERPSKAPPSESSEADDQPVSVAAESVAAEIYFDPIENETDIKQLTATTNVSVSRAGQPNDSDSNRRTGDPFSIESETLKLTNDGGNHILELKGAPARIRHPEAEIEGNLLWLDRKQNLATVKGEGALTVLVDSDLQDRPLEGEKKPLTIRWDKEMQFDGQQAHFVENVRSSLAESTIVSHTMNVSLNKRIPFSEDRPQIEGLEIDRIHCQGQVVGEFREWDGSTKVWIGFRQVRVHDFVMERESGDFHARGPGVIDDWSRGGTQRRRVRISSATSSNANQPIRNDEWPWDYTGVEFAGEMSGNQRDRYVTLNDRVEVMHGPVKKAFTKINRDEEFARETERSKNAIFLGSDKLRVSLVGGEDGSEPTVEAIAYGDAELEGLVFRGRAHSISYDEAKGMFTLKGRGTEAFLWHQERPGAEIRELSTKTIQFVPSEKLFLDQARSIQGGH